MTGFRRRSRVAQAGACKALYAGSNPAAASILMRLRPPARRIYAGFGLETLTQADPVDRSISVWSCHPPTAKHVVGPGHATPLNRTNRSPTGSEIK